MIGGTSGAGGPEVRRALHEARARRVPSGASARNVEQTPPRRAPDGDAYRTTDTVSATTSGSTRGLDEIEYSRGWRRREHPDPVLRRGTSGGQLGDHVDGLPAPRPAREVAAVVRAQQLAQLGARRTVRRRRGAGRTRSRRDVEVSVVSAPRERRAPTAVDLDHAGPGPTPVTASHSATRLGRVDGHTPSASPARRRQTSRGLSVTSAGTRAPPCREPGRRQQPVADDRDAGVLPRGVGRLVPGVPRTAGSAPVRRRSASPPSGPATTGRASAAPVGPTSGSQSTRGSQPRRPELVEALVEPAPVPAEVGRSSSRRGRAPRNRDPSSAARVGRGQRLPERGAVVGRVAVAERARHDERGRPPSAGRAGEASSIATVRGASPAPASRCADGRREVLGVAGLRRPQHHDLARVVARRSGAAPPRLRVGLGGAREQARRAGRRPTGRRRRRTGRSAAARGCPARPPPSPARNPAR